jgi:branched-chain amino acid transport system substrate-binding protein
VFTFTTSAQRAPQRRSRKSLTVLIVLPVAVALLATGCASSSTTPGGSSSKSTEPIKVGVLASTTGALATYGIAEKQGIDIAIDEANASGGINGAKIDPIYYDPAGDTATAIQQVNRMVQQDGVKIILDASASSGVGLAIKPIAQAAKIVMITAGAAAALTDPASASPLTFGTTLSTDVVAQKMMEYLNSKSVKSVGILASSDGYGQSGAVSLAAAATKAGVTQKTVQYDPTATDLTSQLRAMQDSKYGAIINWTSGSTGVVFFKNAQQLNISAKSLVMQSFTFSNPALMKQAGDASKGVIVAGIKATLLSVLKDSDPDKAMIAKFNSALEKKYNVPVTIYAAQAHDAALVAFAGIKAAKSTDFTKLAAAIEKLRMQGVQGTYTYSANDHRGLGTANLEMMQWDGTAFTELGSN